MKECTKIIWETIKCTHIVDEYLKEHEESDKAEFNFEFKLFFMPPQNSRNLIFYPKQEPPYVPIEHDKVMVQRGRTMLHLHDKIVDGLLNLIPFSTLMKLRDLQVFKQLQLCGDGALVVKIRVPQHHKPKLLKVSLNP